MPHYNFSLFTKQKQPCNAFASQGCAMLTDLTEGEGLEPPSGCPRRISSAVPYQLGLALQGTAGADRGSWIEDPLPSDIGETGFEPATPASRTQCSTGLSYSPRNFPDRIAAVLSSSDSALLHQRADREGFEPSRAIHPTRFPIVLLKPLGHLSNRRKERKQRNGEGGIRTHARLASVTV